MTRHRAPALSGAILLTGSMLAAGSPASAAEVTPARLVNADKEPQNWLMNHRTYDGQRYSPLTQLWKVNVGTGFSAPPITFEVNGKQYLAITSGPGASAKSRLANTPELKDQGNATVLYVFSL